MGQCHHKGPSPTRDASYKWWRHFIQKFHKYTWFIHACKHNHSSTIGRSKIKIIHILIINQNNTFIKHNYIYPFYIQHVIKLFADFEKEINIFMVSRKCPTVVKKFLTICRRLGRNAEWTVSGALTVHAAFRTCCTGYYKSTQRKLKSLAFYPTMCRS